MLYNRDSDKSSLYNTFYGDQYLPAISNENTSLKEKEPEKIMMKNMFLSLIFKKTKNRLFHLTNV